ncbi:hypothetical protein ACTXT7_006907 [Hymenolepis weldensis]
MSEPVTCIICLDEVKLPKGRPDCCQHTFCFDCIFKCSIFDCRCPLDKKEMQKIQIIRTLEGLVSETLTLSDGSLLVETNENHEANNWLRQLRGTLTCIHILFSNMLPDILPGMPILIDEELRDALMDFMNFFRDFRAFFEATGTVFCGNDLENYSHTMDHLKCVILVLDIVFDKCDISTHRARLPIREHVTDFEAHVGYVHHYIIEFLRHSTVVRFKEVGFQSGESVCCGVLRLYGLHD